MALSTYSLQHLGDYLAGIAVQIKLHSGDPGSAGTSNTTTAGAGTPTWASTSSGGVLDLASAINFTGGAGGGTCSWVSLWTSGGSQFLGRFQITSGDTTFNAAGEYTLDSCAITFS